MALDFDYCTSIGEHFARGKYGFWTSEMVQVMDLIYQGRELEGIVLAYNCGFGRGYIMGKNQAKKEQRRSSKTKNSKQASRENLGENKKD